jgi:hypothetical protein
MPKAIYRGKRDERDRKKIGLVPFLCVFAALREKV